MEFRPDESSRSLEMNGFRYENGSGAPGPWGAPNLSVLTVDVVMSSRQNGLLRR